MGIRDGQEKVVSSFHIYLIYKTRSIIIFQFGSMYIKKGVVDVYVPSVELGFQSSNPITLHDFIFEFSDLKGPWIGEYTKGRLRW